jgi:octaprenyl-diphosphate synthase
LVAYAFHRSGKNIRSQLMISLAIDCGIDPLDPRLLKLITIVELIHSGTLFHDDVIDDSPVRRGQPAVHMIFGNKPSILLGDYCFTQAYMIAQELESSESLVILPKLAKTAQSLVEGELWQLQWKNKALSLKDYNKIIQLKTGCLFQFACESLSIFQVQSPISEALLWDFGRSFGALYQLLDDYQDYYHNSDFLRKDPGQDFRERKVTLPILLAIEEGLLTFAEFFDTDLDFKELSTRIEPVRALCLSDLQGHYNRCRELLSQDYSHTAYVLSNIIAKLNTTPKYDARIL